MTRERIESLVAEYLDLRGVDASLSPEKFADRYPDLRDEVLAHVRGALEVLDLLPSGRDGESHPEWIGPYRVVRELGRGGMGIVYEVERDGERRALKLLPLAPFQGPHALERFRREAVALTRLEHPSIIKVLDSGFDRGVPYLVLELIDGPTLDRVTEPLAPRHIAAWLETLARALAVAHRHGIVHRDLKPQNVILRDGEPVLLDFGLVRSADEVSLTGTGDLVGTPRYLAPEQARSERVDARTDVHGLGLIGYELLARRPVFAADRRERVLAAIVGGRWEPLATVAPAVPMELVRIVHCALATDPVARYAGALEMADDLARFQAGADVHAPVIRARRTTGVWARVRRGWVALARRLGAKRGGSMGSSSATIGSDPRDPSASRAAVEAWLDRRDDSCREFLATSLDMSDPTWLALDAWVREAEAPVVDSLPAAQLLTAMRRFARAPDDDNDDDDDDDDEVASALFGLEGEGLPLAGALRGLVAIRRGRLREAETSLVAAIANYPSSATLAGALASVHDQRGHPEAARVEYERALRIRPEDGALWLQLARTCASLDQLPAARAALARAESLAGAESVRDAESPRESDSAGSLDSAEVRVVRAELLIQDGRREAAQEILERVVREQPDDFDAWRALATCRDSAHDIAQAAHAYERANELRPSDARTLLCRANLHAGADLGRCERCDVAFERHPELLDSERADELLARCVAVAGDANLAFLDSIQHVALKLRRCHSTLAALDAALPGCEDPSAVTRLRNLRRRLRERASPRES